MTAKERIPLLEMRARIVAAIRSFFDGQGFVEVETAVRIAAPAPEEHIDCPVVPPPSAPVLPETDPPVICNVPCT